ncbi:unnamed protein product [Paramecium primaurelia]|uniref:Uncharacterized protein n=1 Tax=Paramecium primaurelia TaxID=5886 RepID=A0A8S1NXG1_PARPR|nr:unnamed protein product [Paramecium primaurelia]
MSIALSLKEDSFKLDDPISNISERVSKKEQIEMKRQLDIMVNRIKLLAIQKQKFNKLKLKLNILIIFEINIISILREYKILLGQMQKSKETRNQSLQLYRDMKKQQKQDQIKLQQQIRLTIQQQKQQKFQQMKLQSLQYDKFITLQKERSKSFNVEKKHKVQQQEQQIQQNLEQFKLLKQQQFKSQHKQVVLNNYLKKANDFVKIHQLWDLEKSLIDSLISSTNSFKKI